MSWLRESSQGCVISVHAAPRASKDTIAGTHGDALKVRLNAPPVDGKANDRLLKFLAEKLGVPGAAVSLLRGQSSREKQVLVSGLAAAEIRARLQAE